MKFHAVHTAAIVLALAGICLAQGRVGRPSRGNPSQPRVGSTSPGQSAPSLFISGKVAIEDGTPLTDRPSVQSVCQGRIHTEAYTDSHGGFSFEFRGQSTATSSTGVDIGDAEGSITNPTGARGSAQRNWRDCELRASLPGFTSDVIEMASRPLDSGNTDVGQIVLHRIGNVNGITISATTAAAPSDARKAYEKALDKEHKNHSEDAEKLLQKAVQLYPRYAVAWFELGKLQSIQNDAADARQSFQQAIAADDKYVSPYHGLTQIAWKEKNWHEVIQFSDKLLALNPVNFPDVWFLNAVSQYFLQDLSAAEKGAREGLRVDSGHRIPKLEYLLGMILMERRNFPEATQHLQRYITLVRTPADVAEAQKLLNQINQLSAQNAGASPK